PTPAEEVDDADVRTALAAAGLGHLADRLDEEAEWNTLLSGGEQQRVGVAGAVIHRPDVLLLDWAVSVLESGEGRYRYGHIAGRLLSRSAAPRRCWRSTSGPSRWPAPRQRAARRARRPWHRCPHNRYNRSTPPEGPGDAEDELLDRQMGSRCRRLSVRLAFQ